MSSSLPGSPPRGPPSPSNRDRPRRQAISRACDRCRRRKAKCDYDNGTRTCSLCRDNNVGCTFDLPLAKRGPKSKKNSDPAIPPEAISTFPGSGALLQQFGGLHPPHQPHQQPLHPPPPVSPARAGRTPTSSNGAATFASPSDSSSASWEPIAQLTAISAGLSPTSLRDLAQTHQPAAQTVTVSAAQRWRNLSRALALSQNKSLETVVGECFDLFFRYLYPLTPLVHESSLRDGFSFFTSQATSGGIDSVIAETPSIMNPPPAQGPDAMLVPGSEASAHWNDAAFTLITAVCAEAAFLLPKDLFPGGASVADLLLQASRDCLNDYLEADLENPNANSITIRYFHSNCVHAAGKPKYSWHIFGEATRLAQVMRLYDESSLSHLSPIEVELRRRAFWIVYMGDKSAAILNDRPITMHKYSFENGITTAFPIGIDETSGAVGNTSSVTLSSDPQPRNFIAGFNANLRLWQAASELLIQIRLFRDQKAVDTGLKNLPGLVLTEAEKQCLNSLYVHFITCMDDLPPYLSTYAFPSGPSGEVPLTTESHHFVIQCANLQMSYHCLRMVITQKFEEIAFFEPADLRKTEIARDMLRVMCEAPFWSLQVNGEPYVEKIRLVGATLLSIIHRNGTSALAIRARHDFDLLLDLLTRLDSKASDALKSTSTCAL